MAHIINNPHAIYFNGELIGIITNPDPAGDLFSISEALSPDNPELCEMRRMSAVIPELRDLVERLPVTIPIATDDEEPGAWPFRN